MWGGVSSGLGRRQLALGLSTACREAGGGPGFLRACCSQQCATCTNPPLVRRPSCAAHAARRAAGGLRKGAWEAGGLAGSLRRGGACPAFHRVLDASLCFKSSLAVDPSEWGRLHLGRREPLSCLLSGAAGCRPTLLLGVDAGQLTRHYGRLHPPYRGRPCKCGGTVECTGSEAN